MTYSVGTLWIIYVAVLVGIWILLWIILVRETKFLPPEQSSIVLVRDRNNLPPEQSSIHLVRETKFLPPEQSSFHSAKTQCYSGRFSYGTAFFLATIFGAIAAFIGAAWLDPNQLTDSDKSWLTVLFLVAFLLPIFVLLYLFWFGQSKASPSGSCCPKNSFLNSDRIKRTIQCDRETGLCHLQKKTIYQENGDITEVIYTK